ncbi:hypothetical protein [Rhodococcus sp. NPDC057529]|uniref:hypothetical protein n=1 Tax=Rhodococcus sp. NPDC057529 TaxID=3346158 RepID=UPI00366C843E
MKIVHCARITRLLHTADCDRLIDDTVGERSRPSNLCQPMAVRVLLGDSQAQLPPTMDISWQGRYTVNLHVVTSGA